MRRGYCQREEEGESRCRGERCEGCKEYYRPLEEGIESQSYNQIETRVESEEEKSII